MLRRPQTRARKTKKASRAGQRARKISITVDPAVLQDVERAAKRAGRTLSSQITVSLGRDLRREHLRSVIEEYEATHGPITEADLAAIRDEWQD